MITSFYSLRSLSVLLYTLPLSLMWTDPSWGQERS